ncbi:filamentous hemagglutinin N-terminal domain-containing protein [Paraburkholderia graminis]|uniref:two-partner secretion domain-containing protein n=1 Tax=Paraburkholderia graminis TaxID=60548 RepID=UPI003C9CF725
MIKKITRETSGRVTEPNYRFAVLPAMLAAALGCSSTAWAVEGGMVAAGAGTIKTQANKTTISQSSDKMIVNWKNFNIGQDQSVVVNQPGTSSALLNRVTTASPTQIDGVLKANGRVFVVNPAGVVFGNGAKVNVGSLVASTLDMNDQQFMEGGKLVQNKRYLNFSASGGEGKVTNNGQLTAQESVALLGPQVVNNGSIRAKDVALGAANGVAMAINDSGFPVQVGRQAEQALAANYGVIVAKGGNATLSAAATGAVLGTVIQNNGQIEATSASAGQGGTVQLASRDGGKISANGQMTADSGISITSSAVRGNVAPAFYQMFDSSAAPRAVSPAPSSREVTVGAGATLKTGGSVQVHSDGARVDMNGLINAGGDVSIGSAAYDGDNMTVPDASGVVTTNGRINARSVYLDGADVNVNAPIRALDSVYAQTYTGDMHQRANVMATTGSVNMISGANLVQADGVNTSAGTGVTLKSESRLPVWPRRPNGSLRLANVQAKTINIDGGDVTLTGNVKADGNISVNSRMYNPPCPADMACIAVMAGGQLSQTGNVVSGNGDVALHADASLSQSRFSRTKAGNNVTLSGRNVETGTVQAGNRITVDANFAHLGGKLTAQEINLPANTTNKDGNIRILPKSANL